jgi:Flp pilus assembly protein TadG
VKQLVRKSKTRWSGRRRGVAAVEGALVLSAFLVILFGMLDLGLLVLNFNTLSEASRRLCRQAIVHGSAAAPKMTVWGPTTVTGTAADGSEYAQALNAEMATFNLKNVKYTVAWPDGANQYDNRVQVTVTYAYQPMIPFVLGSATVPLQVVTTMYVGH